MITCASRAGEACGFGHLVFSVFWDSKDSEEINRKKLHDPHFSGSKSCIVVPCVQTPLHFSPKSSLLSPLFQPHNLKNKKKTLSINRKQNRGFFHFSTPQMQFHSFNAITPGIVSSPIKTQCPLLFFY